MRKTLARKLAEMAEAEPNPDYIVIEAIQRSFGPVASEIFCVRKPDHTRYHDLRKSRFFVTSLNYGWIRVEAEGVKYMNRDQYRSLIHALEHVGDVVTINGGFRFRFKLNQGRD
jgi:hypothetical protein